MLTEKEVKKFLKEENNTIKRAVKEALVESIKEQVKYDSSGHIRTAVQDFVKEEIAPYVVEQLQKDKGAILKAVDDALASIGANLAAELKEKASKNLANSWDFDKVVKALFD